MSDTDSLCRQIAAALDITPEELRAVQIGRDRAAELRGIADMLKAFRQLPDEAARRRCVSYVEAEARRSKSAPSEEIDPSPTLGAPR